MKKQKFTFKILIFVMFQNEQYFDENETVPN